MNHHIEFEREDDGRWIAEIPDCPGVMAYGITKDDAKRAVLAIAAQLAW
jgi:predicted RNase H-like HicB family nuclease